MMVVVTWKIDQVSKIAATTAASRPDRRTFLNDHDFVAFKAFLMDIWGFFAVSIAVTACFLKSARRNLFYRHVFCNQCFPDRKDRAVESVQRLLSVPKRQCESRAKCVRGRWLFVIAATQISFLNWDAYTFR